MRHVRTSALLLAALAEGDGGSGGGTGGGSGDTGKESGGDKGAGSGGSGSGEGKPGDGSGSGGDKGGRGPSGDRDTEHRLDNQPQWVQALVRELRDEAGDHRTKRSAAERRNDELLEAIGSALGLTKDDKKDPEKLTTDLASAGQRIKTLETELAVHQHAPDAGGDAHALLDSRSFMDTLAGLDPAASDYSSRVKDKIKSAVEANARLGTSSSGSNSPFRPNRAGIGQEKPGTGVTSTGVAAGRELRQARNKTRSGQQQTTQTKER